MATLAHSPSHRAESHAPPSDLDNTAPSDNYTTTTTEEVPTSTAQPISPSQSASLVPVPESVTDVSMTVGQLDDEPLFSPSLISSDVLALLPEGYTARPLRRSDYHLGYLNVLRVLTTVGDISYEQWSERYNWMAQRNDEYYLMVVCDGAHRIVATGSLIVERKFIHALGKVGHIEDIAVSADQQGKKLGLRVIQTLDSVASKVGCYKVG